MAAFTSPNTGSLITNQDSSNRTGTALSTQILIMVGPNAVGAISEISINEERPVSAIDELGTDGHIDSAPTGSTKVSGSCKRIRYDGQRIANAFSRGFFHPKSQRIGFDINIYDKWLGDGDNTIVTTIKNVWITNISYSYGSDNWIIADTMSWMAEDISSTIGGTANAAGPGSRGIILQTDSAGIEQQTDRGLRRGSLDAAGLLASSFVGFS